ncbi:MAG: hypothetical protein RR290_04120 [Clostridia bacterium]
MEIKKTKKERYTKKKTDNSVLKWFITIFIITFVLSLFFSYLSTESIKGIPIIPGILILVLVIFIGILFDIIGVAVTIAEEDSFHSMASKKLKGSKTAIKLIRNSHKVSNFCADVIGDISGVLSGSISAIISLKITEYYGINFDLQILISALVASITVGGKAIGKSIAKKYNNEIVNIVSKFLNYSKKKSDN